MSKIKENYLVKKRNVLNEIRANNMTLQELRFFAIYLSKINPSDINTRIVRFSIDDFKAIMGLESRIKIDYMRHVTNSLLCKVVNVPTERGGYTGFQLFKKCTVDMDDNNEWYVEINAHDDALSLMFEFKDRYFTYRLWNALSLKSSNQLRMYEILKQYEKIGSRIMTVEDLKNDLGIDKKEYERFNNFKKWVLDACQKALAETTDIKFTYEPYGKRGKGGKILSLKFNIEQNKDYKDQLMFDDFIEQNKNAMELPDEHEEAEPSKYDQRIRFLADACDNEFSSKQIIVLYDLMIEKLPYDVVRDEIKYYRYLNRKYKELNMRSEKTKINNRFAYLKSLIGTD